MLKTPMSAALALTSALLISACSNAPSVGFKKDVLPILTKHCAECHTNNGQGTQKSGFQVDSYESLMKGTKYGPVVIAGDAASSTLYRLVSGKVDKSIQMPHGKKPLTQAEIKALENWIDQGAHNN